MHFHKRTTFVCAALLLTTPAWGTEDRDLVLKGETAVALDGDGTPLVRARREYLLEWAGNPEGHVFEIDQARRRLRISPDSAPALWLNCSDVANSGCAPRTRLPGRSAAIEPGSQPLDRTIPLCPGDPRCPR